MHIKPLFDTSYFDSTSKWQKPWIVLMAYIKRVILIVQLFISPKKYDLVLLEYELFPYFPAWFEYLFAKRGIGYMVDYDDAIFHKYDSHRSTFVKTLFKDKIAKVMTYAQTVIVCNPYLEKYAKAYNNYVITLPTVVQLEKYKEVRYHNKKRKNNTFIIGWIGSKTTSVYVVNVLEDMKKFATKYKNIRFHLVGFDNTLLSKEEKAQAHIDVIPWREVDEIEHILAFDIGMMPLPNDAWSRGKCGFKLIQYMACQKPVVASAVGVNCDLVEEYKGGVLVQSEDLWFDAFEKLYLDDSLRQNMGIYNMNKIEKDYNNIKHTQRYIALLQNYLQNQLQ
jgi:glycosyltransferase involved in cell wall biosynthesis